MRLEHYEMNPANHLTAASLSWGCMLPNTNVKLDLITVVEIVDFFERSKRGGLTFVGSKRYSKLTTKKWQLLRSKSRIKLHYIPRCK